jgi:glucose/arabinose dehydrogenase
MEGARTRIAAALGGTLALLLAGMAAGGAGAAAPLVALDPVAGFNDPVYVAAPPGAPRLLFVVEQSGVIRVTRDGTKLGRPFLDIGNRVTSAGEQGLLSIAFDPGYEQNHRFYVYYTNNDCSQSTGGCNVEVDSFVRYAESPTRAREGSRRTIIEVNHHQANNHNGGQLQVGPDGHLYVSIGDGGTQGDPENDAQRRDSLLGKILRIDPRPAGGYDVPSDNPYVGAQGRDQIFARGLRNPFRISFDSGTGDIWIGDVGFEAWEEIDHETLADATGANFGWHVYEGPDPCGACGFGPGTPPPPGYQAPVHSYGHSSGGEAGCAIIGGYVSHDPDLPALDGDYVYSDNCGGDLRGYDPAGNAEFALGAGVASPTSFGEGAHGELYVASGRFSGDGNVYRLVAP